MRVGPLAADGELVVIFGALVALEALKRVPAGVLILWRPLGASWRVRAASAEARRVLVGLFTPLTMGVQVAGSEAANSLSLEQLQARLSRSRRWLVALQGTDLALLLLVVLGVPVAIESFGGWGLIRAGEVYLALAAAHVVVARVAWSRAMESPPSWRRLIVWGWPFAAATAAQEVLQQAVRGADPAIVLRALLADGAFERWVRPRVYDHLNGERDDAVAALLTESAMRALVARGPGAEYAGARAYCARCGASFARAGGECADCALPLVPVQSA